MVTIGNLIFITECFTSVARNGVKTIERTGKMAIELRCE